LGEIFTINSISDKNVSNGDQLAPMVMHAMAQIVNPISNGTKGDRYWHQRRLLSTIVQYWCHSMAM
jgi:hypothetical protein